MGLVHCIKCGTLFNSKFDSDKYCATCADIDLKNYYLVREFLEKNPRSTIFEISGATGISENRILDFVREGRLMSPDIGNESRKCLICGKIIKKGSLCSNCDIKNLAFKK